MNEGEIVLYGCPRIQDVFAMLEAEGRSEIKETKIIDRGYEDL